MCVSGGFVAHNLDRTTLTTFKRCSPLRRDVKVKAMVEIRFDHEEE